MYWVLSLTLEHHFENDPVAKLEVFEKNLYALLSDLIYVAHKIFERSNNYMDLSKLSPFLCSCFKELWLLIQLYVEKLQSQQFCKDFWYYFNTTIKTERNLQNNNSGNVMEAVESLWLTYHVSRIQGYNKEGLFIGAEHHRIVSNYTLIEQCLKIITNSNDNQIEYYMSSCLYVIASFQTNWWKRCNSFDIIQLLWEYFYKRINKPFSTNNESESFITNIPKSYDYAVLINNIRKQDLVNSSNTTVTSYEIFLCLLEKYLTINPSHWLKLKGRIYSKLLVQKLITFTDVGLHNLVQLFFVLAYAINFTELTDKLQSLLSQLPATFSQESSVIWSMYVSLLFMRTQSGMTLNEVGGTEICTSILLAVHSASSDRSRSHLMRIFIDGLKKLIDNDPQLQYQEHVLFDNWFNQYVQWCSHSDMCHLLDLLKAIIGKICQANECKEWWNKMENHVVPAIKHLTAISDSPQQVVELAATLITANGERFKNLLEYMTGDYINVSFSMKFLITLLEQNKDNLIQLSTHHELLIQAWIRIALLTTNKHELSELTLLMIKIPEWTKIIGVFNIQKDDPLRATIQLAGYRIKSTGNEIMKMFELKRWFETYFGRMDQWVMPVISAAEKCDNAQLILRIYNCAALLFYRCAPALYIKNKNTCILYRLTSTLLLPSSVLMNKKPLNIILAALRRTWPLFIRGIAQLNFKTDNYIERIMKDIVIRYVPYLYDVSSPLIRCMDAEFEDKVTEFIFEKISTTFLTCRLNKIPQFSEQALKLILEISRIQTNVTKINIFVQIFFPPLFEVLIFIEDNSLKQIVFQIISNVKYSSHYSGLVNLIKNSIVKVIDTNLYLYSSNVFRFIESIFPLLPTDVQNINSNLQTAIVKIECMKGIEYDNALRKGLQRIQDLINQQSK